jgi:hypothetical protein
MGRFLLSGVLLFCAAGLAPAQIEIKFGVPVADFPPGQFTDGNQYKLGDLQGKVVVLYFFENK